MEKVRKVVKKYYLRQFITYWLACWMFFGLPAQVAMATVTGGAFQVGTGTINDNIQHSTVLVDQMESVIHWGGLNTSSIESLSFTQGALSNAAVLNRVTGEGAMVATTFNGTLNGVDMRIFMINPAGIVFGDGATINVSQLVASALGMSNDAFHAVVSDVTSKMEFDNTGGGGNVKNLGTLNATNTGSLYLIGQNVYNNGHIVCPDGLVVMAAGGSVKLGQPGSSVIVDLADFTFGTTNYVDNRGGNGIEAKEIVLAASDIWASALTASGNGIASITAMARDNIVSDGDILAEASSGSDAVATIDIVAGGDVYIYDDVEATAIGDIADNATATVNIEAGGSVDIDNADVWAYAYNGAYDGTTNTAELNITANDGHVYVYAGDEFMEVGAWAEGGVDNIANVNITAKSQDIEEPDKAYVLVEAEYNAELDFMAYAADASNSNSATVTINADGPVDLYAHDYGEAYIEAYASNDDEFNTATITIVASDVDVTAEYNSEAEIYAEASYGYDNTATVDVTANDGNVDVYAYDYSDAEIGAEAEYAENNNTAEVTITANGDGDETGHVTVIAQEDSGAWIYSETDEAENSNTSTTTINADGDVLVQASASFHAWSGAGIEAEADDGQNNTANVMVDAGGDVEVIANHGGAKIFAEAQDGDNNTSRIDVIADGDVKVIADSSSGQTSDAWIEAEAEDGFNNDADTVINAGGDVLVMATNGWAADAKISAEAENDIEIYGDEGPEEVSGITNDAKVDITAASIEVIGENDAEAQILAKAKNEIELESYDYAVDVTVNGSLVNDAGVKIVTTGDGDGDVLVEGLWGGEASIGAEAGNDIEVDDDSYYDVDLTINGSLLNTAKTDITATDQVRVIANGYDSGAWIYAEAFNDIGNESDQTAGLIVNGNAQNQADTLIDAGDDTDLDDTCNPKDDLGDDVEVRAVGGGEAMIGAIAENYLYDLHEEGETLNVKIDGFVDNIANTKIITGDEVWVIADNYKGDYSEAGIFAEAINEIDAYDWDWDDELQEDVLYTGIVNLTVTGSVNNQADVAINAGDNIEVDARYDAEAYIAAWTENEIEAGTVSANISGSVNNAAKVDITTGDDVDVTAEFGGAAYIEAEAENDLEDESVNTLDVTVGGSVRNTANVTIDAYEDIELSAGDGGDTWITAEAANDIDGEGVTVSVGGSLDNIATVDMVAGDDVEVEAYMWGDADINARTHKGDDNISGVTIITKDGDVEVDSYDADAGIFAEAWDASNSNTATVAIDAVGGDVEVIDEGYGGYYSAEIVAVAEGAGNSNSADIQITATATTYEDDGKEYVNGGNVEVIALYGGHAEIIAYAAETDSDTDPTSNTANVTIRTTSAERTESVLIKGGGGIDKDDLPIDIYEDVTYTEGGDVTVEAEYGGEAAIQAVTMSSDENTSDVLICAEGEVLVSDKNSQICTAKIISLANHGNINNAYTGVRGAEGISVLADNGRALIASEAMYGLDCELHAELNTAFTSLCTDGDVLVIGLNNGTAEVLASANEGLVNNADIGVCADGDILVAAGLGTRGGTAKIKAKSDGAAYGGDGNTATANVTVVSHNGGVGVIDIEGPTTALIEAEATNAVENNAYVGVAAGADLEPADLVDPVPNGVHLSPIDQWLEIIRPGNVHVEGRGGYANAYILSKAYNGDENTAETVVCAPGEVIVYADSEDGHPIAHIKSLAGWCGDGESLNTALTRIYASEVTVNEEASIVSLAGNDHKSVSNYSLTGDGEVVEEGDATLIIQGYSEAENCPDCPPCPDCDEEDEPIPPLPPAPLGAAPLPGLQGIDFGQGGCPALMEWLAAEVGVAVDVQVFLANAFVSSTDCQPCETAARLKAAATVLTDEDGSNMAAMNQVFNELAPAGAPFTPEVAASIVTAFAGRLNDGTQYAAAIEYIDAFVQYIAILNSEMGSPVADSVAYVMEKYGSDVSDNANMAGFLASRMESGETFAQ